MKFSYPIALFFFLFVAAIAPIAATAQSGRIDLSFNTGDTTPYLRYPVNAIQPLPDGRMIIAFGNASTGPVKRYTSAGILDRSFRSGTGFNTMVKALALQPDGKILAGGSLFSYNGQRCSNITRLHPDGLLDSSFKVWEGLNKTRVNGIIVQADGKILVGGSGMITLARLNPDGSLDSSFSVGGGVRSVRSYSSRMGRLLWEATFGAVLQVIIFYG